MRYISRAAPLIFVSCLAHGQDVSLLAGTMGVRENDQNAFAVQLGYSQPVSDHVAASVEYVNEGHPALHHRDGLASQLWLHTLVPERGWSFAAGIGPYFYFDTTPGRSAQVYRNEHEQERDNPAREDTFHVAPIASVGARYRITPTLRAELTWSRVITHDHRDADLFLLGAGVSF